MPDEYDVLVDLVQALQDKVKELDDRTVSMVGFGLTNELNRIEQELIGIKERLGALEAKKNG